MDIFVFLKKNHIYTSRAMGKFLAQTWFE